MVKKALRMLDVEFDVSTKSSRQSNALIISIIN